MRRAVLGACFAALMLSSTAWAAAPALFRFHGTVTDALGRPMANASVRDGSQTALTDEAGSYELPELFTGSYTLTAFRTDTLNDAKTVNATVPNDQVVDFVLRFRMRLELSRATVSTRGGPAAVTLTIHSYAPSPGTPSDDGASCVAVTDARTNITSGATLASVNPDGSSLWTYVLTLPQGSSEGVHQLSVVAEDCVSGVDLTQHPSITYVVDNTLPTLTRVSGDWAAPKATVVVTARDSGGSGLSVNESAVYVDGVLLSKPYSYTSATGELRASVAGLQPGSHQALIDVSDWSGNHATLSWTFNVDGQGPALYDPTPVGEVTSRTPRLAVKLADFASGVEAETLTMTLGYGPLDSVVPASYDPETGELSYQVPALPEGVGIGRLPLLDGHYSVMVLARDSVGNASTLAWTFAVRTLPLEAPSRSSQ